MFLTNFPVFRFHNFIVESPPLTTLIPSCWKHVIGPVCPSSTHICCPVSVSHTLRVLSAPPETKTLFLNESSPTNVICPSSVLKQAPVSKDHCLMSPSMEPEKIILRSSSTANE
ncbi:hypothetical protein AX774_g5095 [Zancudomyces culisetae]|uniref:Uncharacterized protein n=1 Tax=Zancudomyces culisetae TaxID=1213189 RepID=A0A1R1PKF8_ZANCU|nr:hypothetical protein AX774_g5095 [Zancudomyces culisetae]|eukprot:OMH81446.1 hypothetical protein AX774_g5095 [Zancudomyces culisetae]